MERTPLPSTEDVVSRAVYFREVLGPRAAQLVRAIDDSRRRFATIEQRRFTRRPPG